MVARRAHNPEAAGSNPVPATMKNKTVATLPFLFFINKLEGFEAAEQGKSLRIFPKSEAIRRKMRQRKEPRRTRRLEERRRAARCPRNQQ